MTISLPDAMKDLVIEETARHGYSPADAHVQALVHQDRQRRILKHWKAKLLAGLEGPSVTINRAERERIRQETIAGPSGEEIRP